MASEIIGLGECINCEATVEYKRNVAGRAFYRCNGSADPKRRGCGLEVKAFGLADTDKIVKALKKESDDVVKAGSEARKAGGAKPAVEPGHEQQRSLTEELFK